MKTLPSSRAVFQKRLRRGLPIFLLLAPTLNAAEVQNVTLTVGGGWALVRELRSVPLQAGLQDLLLPDLPETADLSTLTVRHRRLPVELLGWKRAGPLVPVRHPALMRSGEGVAWLLRARSGAPEARERHPVSCSVQSPVSGPQTLEVGYVLGGLAWAATYQLGVRGDLSDERDPVSIDLVGRVAVSNRTDRAFPNATLYLVGADRAPGRAPGEAPGWLLVPPFAEPRHEWKPEAPPPRADPAYALPSRWDLAALATTEALFAFTRRAPARRVYGIDAERFQYAANTELPMDKLVIMENSAKVGLGFPLPQGAATVYLGAIGTRLWDSGELPRTAAGGEIRVHLGLAEQVTVRRRVVGTTRLTTGNLEESFEITLINRLNSPVLAEVNAEPEYATAWEVTRTSQPVEREGRHLAWTPTVPANGETVIRYQIRVQPSGAAETGTAPGVTPGEGAAAKGGAGE